MRRALPRRPVAVAAVLAVAAGLLLWASPTASADTTTFTTVGSNDFVVPAGVTSITIDAYGADGGAGVNFGGGAPAGGTGGRVQGTIAVTPGETLKINVGGKGGSATGAGGGAAGTNGGAVGGAGAGGAGGGGGGGASDVRRTPYGTSDRLAAAGGGGGGGGEFAAATGGNGGGASGAAGSGSVVACGGSGGSGGTAGAGGAPGPTCGTNAGGGGSGTTGGIGGDGAEAGGGGGGGGAGGGGGGGGGLAGAGGGGGGAALIPAGGSATAGVSAGNAGNGKVILTWTVGSGGGGYSPPNPPRTDPATDVTATSATLHGVTPAVEPYHYEYGTTAPTSRTVDATPTRGYTDLPVTITGLQPSTSYVFRIVTAEAPGKTLSFTTLDAPPPPSAPPPPPPLHPFGSNSAFQYDKGQVQQPGGGASSIAVVLRPGGGHWSLNRNGTVDAYDGAPSLGGTTLRDPISIATTITGGGYWILSRDGRVQPFGDAPDYGSMFPRRLNKGMILILPTPSGNGYWLIANDGGVFTFGDAVFFGSNPQARYPDFIVGATATLSGNGYWLLADDGAVFSWGDAVFHDRPRAMSVAMFATDDGNYVVVGTDGTPLPH